MLKILAFLLGVFFIIGSAMTIYSLLKESENIFTFIPALLFLFFGIWLIKRSLKSK